ncbi:L,D-transpeptidase [Lactobacillus sp. ESL0785]|uniref:L,D-transpeptidase n=1 Tax=Lactobacillus sp. ESL0785 TaxID=2983232 RepID=UPI0023F7A2F0|nr:L,D-transpeptidase [Lactobacillus sp. ESL0785]WEV70450.1 L,D-transpeptidase [Lactobacillus sp. ESL0785]
MKKSLLKPLTFCFVILICVISLARLSMPNVGAPSSKPKQQEVKTTAVKKKTAASFRPYQDPADLRQPLDWHQSSEYKSYPKIKRLENDITIRVSLKGNRVYILRDNRRIYTMLASGGLFKKGKSLTPTGSFKIQDSRGDSFYNPNLNEGANNWTSWDPNNVYLFHSVPTKDDGQYNVKEAKKLGKTQGSHGCIRLSIADSHWLLKNIKVGTKVIIKDN